MSGTTEAFSRVKIDALLKDAGWNLTDGSSVLFEYSLPDPLNLPQPRIRSTGTVTMSDHALTYPNRRIPNICSGLVS